MSSNVVHQFQSDEVDVSFPKLRSVEWLAETLGLSKKQTYEAISSAQIPSACVVRIGRRVRIIEQRLLQWVLRGKVDEGAHG